jgi:cob(I)alamin adenosyltransferase
MGNRLSEIVTGTGDYGETGLADGSRVPKDSPRVEAMGDIDELNSTIGLLLSWEMPPSMREMFREIQHHLFDLGGELSLPGHTLITDDRLAYLEHHIETLNEQLTPLKEFILPGGGHAGSVCHLARAVCRRTERRLCTLARAESVNTRAVVYVNRLSDLLFIAARHLAQASGHGEIYWRSQRRQASDT